MTPSPHVAVEVRQFHFILDWSAIVLVSSWQLLPAMFFSLHSALCIIATLPEALERVKYGRLPQ